MRIVLSSNPYRDKGLRAAQEAQKILNRAGADTVLCLPFIPKKGDRFDIPRNIKLGKLDEHGQHISIRIELDRKAGTGTVSFISGWMVEPNGKIRLATPYGGK